MHYSKIGIVIPCYKTANTIIGVIKTIPDIVDIIYVVDDKCPQETGLIVSAIRNPRVKVIYNKKNLGVGGAVIAGYREAVADGCLIVVKLDGDGQMDSSLIPAIIAPIIGKQADYTKGNRFYDLDDIGQMPKIRIFGNAVLSFFNKISSGYWNIFDPTNGYTAIHALVLKKLPLDKISNRYFFESDILFRLNTIRAVVCDVPMTPIYGDEVSNLKIMKVIPEFLAKHFINFNKRIFYNYYLRDLSIASFELPVGICLITFAITYGIINLISHASVSQFTPAGTVGLTSICMIMGMQFLLSFISFDTRSIPTIPRQLLNIELDIKK
jgi:dolichol-phosphate mannosyltransferase